MRRSSLHERKNTTFNFDNSFLSRVCVYVVFTLVRARVFFVSSFLVTLVRMGGTLFYRVLHTRILSQFLYRHTRKAFVFFVESLC